MNALDLNQQERGNFLLVGSYLLTDEETAKIIEENKQKIDTGTYPTYLMDFSLKNLKKYFCKLKISDNNYGFLHPLAHEAPSQILDLEGLVP